MSMRYAVKQLLLAMGLISCSSLYATEYTVPSGQNALIGRMQYQEIAEDKRIPDLQQQYNIGYNALTGANPHIDPEKGLPAGATIVIPTQHLLPSQARHGIVINLPEMRMYYYLPNSNKVLTYPIGIGKVGKTIPIVNASVARKKENPIWVPPADIREYNLEQGIVLPKVLPAGPDNPLGPYAIYLSVPTYLIHSTIFPESIGKRASFGCIRMYQNDIKEFFPSVTNGVPVIITNSPVKVGWESNVLYVEAHPPLIEHNQEFNSSVSGIVQMVDEATKNQPTLVDWQLISYLEKDRDGIPHDVGIILQK